MSEIPEWLYLRRREQREDRQRTLKSGFVVCWRSAGDIEFAFTDDRVGLHAEVGEILDWECEVLYIRERGVKWSKDVFQDFMEEARGLADECGGGE